MGALHPCIVNSAGGALQERLVSERTGPIGSVARQRCALEDFLQARAGVLYRYGFVGESVEAGEKD